MAVHPAFVAGGGVFLDDAFARHAVDDGHGRFKGRVGVVFVFGLNGGADFFNDSAEH